MHGDVGAQVNGGRRSYRLTRPALLCIIHDTARNTKCQTGLRARAYFPDLTTSPSLNLPGVYCSTFLATAIAPSTATTVTRPMYWSPR